MMLQKTAFILFKYESCFWEKLVASMDEMLEVVFGVRSVTG